MHASRRLAILVACFGWLTACGGPGGLKSRPPAVAGVHDASFQYTMGSALRTSFVPGCGVARRFQVSLNKVEPRRGQALLATCSPKIIGGFADQDEWNHAGHRCRSSSNPAPWPAAEKGWQGQEPVHQLVDESATPARRRAYGPAADAGEEMALGVGRRSIGFDVSDVSFVYVARCD